MEKRVRECKVCQVQEEVQKEEEEVVVVVGRGKLVWRGLFEVSRKY